MGNRTTTTNNVRANLSQTKRRIKVRIDENRPGVFNTKTSLMAEDVDHLVEIIWENPTQPLTLVLATGYTEQKKPFILKWGWHPPESMSNIYQIVNGEEKEQSRNEIPLKLQSDSDFQVIIKLVPASDKNDAVTIAYVLEPL